MSEQISRRKLVLAGAGGAIAAAAGGCASRGPTRAAAVVAITANAKIWEFYNNFKANWQDNNPANGAVDGAEFLAYLQNYPQTVKVPQTAVSDLAPWDIPQLRFLQAVASWEGLFKPRQAGDPPIRPLTIIEKPLLACAVWAQGLNLAALQAEADAGFKLAAPVNAKIWEAYADFKAAWVDADTDNVVDEPELELCIDNYAVGNDPGWTVTEPPPWDAVQLRFLQAIIAWEGLLAPRAQGDPTPRPLAPTEKRMLKCVITSLPDALMKALLAIMRQAS